ncbi:MAG TPA: hypothetical protein P5050_11010 [Bacteroidia bacterium]|nr:hypothetical protein [Bacteroidia bacterium]HRS59735.1 hypothetical protein [Bacteroidia bacterium]HRU68175.1 hypothetical protein [Bacteroidia bacterium]
MKKILSLLVIGMFLIGFVACNKTKKDEAAAEEPAVEETVPAEEAQPAEQPAQDQAAPAEQPAEQPAAEQPAK